MNDKNKELNDFLKQIDKTIIDSFNAHYKIYSLRNNQERQKVRDFEIQNIKDGWIENEYGNYYNLFQNEIDEKKLRQKEKERVLDNVLIPALKIQVDEILSYNHANDFINHKHSKEYINFRKEVYPQLEKSGINKIINKKTTNLLKIKLYIQVKNTRKDTDNIEKTIIDTLSRYLGINDNKFKEKVTKVIELKDKSKKDVFVISIENLSEENLLKDFIF